MRAKRFSRAIMPLLLVAACCATSISPVSAGKITYSVSGKVYTSDTGEGVAGVTVTATRAGQEGLNAVKTDAHGAYRIDGILPGPCSVTLGPDCGFLMGWSKISRSVQGLPEQEVQGVDFALSAGVSVGGRVQDASGAPVTARITAWIPKEGEKEQYADKPFFDVRASASATSGQDGTFLLRGFSEDQTLTITAEHVGYGEAWKNGLKLGKNGVKDLVLTLSPAASIEGTVNYPDGQPANMSSVLAISVESSDGLGHQGRPAKKVYLPDPLPISGQRAGFHFGKLAGGKYRLYVTQDAPIPSGGNGSIVLSSPLDSLPEGAPPAMEIQLAPGERRTGLCVVLQRDPRFLSISGVVKDKEGKPLDNISVGAFNRMLGGASVQTGPDGSYELYPLRAGKYDLQIVGASVRQNVPAGSEHVDLIPVQRAAVRGRVVRADTGAPVENLELMTVFHVQEADEANFYKASSSAFKVAKGPDFELSNLSLDQHMLVIRSAGFAPAIVPINLKAGKTADVGEVRLSSGASIKGIVTDISGAPVPGAYILLSYLFPGNDVFSHISDNASDAVTFTTKDGSYMLEHVPVSLTAIAAYHPDHFGKVVNMKLAEGQTTTVNIKLDETCDLEGKVTFAGKPAANQKVELMFYSPHGMNRETSTDEKGVYRFKGVPAAQSVPPGHVANGQVVTQTTVVECELRLSASIEDSQNAKPKAVWYFGEKTSTVVGKTVERDLAVPAFPGVIEGKLAHLPAEGGAPMVRIESPTNRRLKYYVSCTPAPDGAYRIGNLPIGAVKLEATVFGVKQTALVTVKAGDPVVQDFDFGGMGHVRGEIRGIDPGETVVVGALPGKKTYNEIIAELRHANLAGECGYLRYISSGNGPYDLFVDKPGKYTVFAMAQFIHGADQTPRFKSEQVTLAANETKTLDFNMRGAEQTK